MSTPKPSWDEARERREALLFKNEEEGDGAEAGKRKKWRLFESPDAIQTQSSGLGLYFKTMNYLLIISVLMSLVGIGPLIANNSAGGFREKYRLIDAGAQPQDCSRTYEVGGAILETSLGNWCGRRDDMAQSFASASDCAAQCLYPSTSSTSLSSLGLCELEGSSLVADSSCASRTPCSTSCAAPTLEESVAWLWCIIGTLVWAIWMRLLKRMQNRAAADYNLKNVTSADFSVWMSNLPSKAESDDELRKFAEHYGEVVAAFHIRRMGNVLNLNNQLEDAERHLAETKALAYATDGLWDMLYKRYICGLFSGVEDATKKLEASIEDLKLKLKDQQERDLEEYKPTGNAVVVFKYSRHKRNMTEDHMRSNTFADLLLTPALHRQFDVLFGGWFSGAPRFQVQDNSGLPINGEGQHAAESTCFTRPPGHFIRVQRAPEPDEIWWENTVSRFPFIWLRRAASWVAYLALIGVSCALQLWITFAAEDERERRLGGRGAVDDSAGALNENSLDDGFQTLASSLSSLSLWRFALLQGLIVTGLNIVVLPVVGSLATYERHQTTTSYLTVMVFKLTVFYFLNSFAVPIMAYSIAANPQSWFTSGGIAEGAFYIQLTNAFVPDLLAVVDTPMFSYHVLSRFARTQDYLNAAIQPRDFNVPLRFSNAIKTVALGVLWAPALPVSPILSVFGILISYCADQFLALHRCRKPPSFDVEALNVVNTIILDALPLVQMLIIYFIYFADDGNTQVIAAFSLGVILWGIAFLTPVDFLFASTRNKNVEPDGSDRYSFDALWGLGMPGTSTNHSSGFVLGSRRQKAIDDIRVLDDSKILRPKFYYPMLPSEHLSAQWAKLVTDKFAISASGPNHEARLRGQQARYSAPNATKDPPNIKEIKKSIKVRRDSLVRNPAFPQADYDDSLTGPSMAPVVPTTHAKRPTIASPLYGASGGNLSHLQRPGYYASPFLARLQESSNIPTYLRPTSAYPPANAPVLAGPSSPQPSAPPLPTDPPVVRYPPVQPPPEPSAPMYPPGYYPGQSASHNPNFPKA